MCMEQVIIIIQPVMYIIWMKAADGYALCMTLSTHYFLLDNVLFHSKHRLF